MPAFDPLMGLADRSCLLFFCYDLTTDRFSYLNPAFLDFFDTADGQISYQELLVLVHSEDRQYLQNKLQDCLGGKAVSDLEFRIIRGENEYWLRVSPFLLEHASGRAVAGHAQDITDFKAYNTNLANHNNKKNSILNILAHDLAGPVGNIGNLAELLKRETAKQDYGKLDEYIGLVGKIAKDCMNLIREFLNQEFLESQGVGLIKRRVELVSRISTAMQEYFGMQQDLQLQFSCQANRDSIYTEIDEDKFLQVISNLISNAMKFTPDGGKITISIEERKHHILIAVADTGIGIPGKYHRALFDKFSQARRSGLKGQHSTGLGMSIIKTIVDWHQGKIWFQSEENKGTTFYIELPK